MRIKFIYPNEPLVDFAQIRLYWYPLISFPLLAGYMPEDEDYEIDIIDEVFEPIDFDDNDVDLVGLTGMTFMAPRAYEIADAFREKGVPVIMGGVHASALPHEAKLHCDAVIMGEAELIWPRVLQDVKNNTLKPFYKAEQQFDMRQYKPPKIELMEKYFLPGKRHYPHGYNSLNMLEISRGCPFSCDYCVVTDYFGADYRSRPIESVMQHIRELKLRYRDRVMTFNDDNLLGSRPYLIEFLKALKRVNVHWSAQISVNVANDEYLWKLFAESGLKAFFVGFESISEESLALVNKRVNKVKNYHKFMEKCQKYGVKVVGSFMFGLDADDESSFEKTVQFAKQYDLLTPSYTIITPFPGTRTFRKLQAEDRLLHYDWRHYNLGEVVIKPKRMSAETLRKGHQWAMSQVDAYVMNRAQIREFQKKIANEGVQQAA